MPHLRVWHAGRSHCPEDPARRITSSATWSQCGGRNRQAIYVETEAAGCRFYEGGKSSSGRNEAVEIEPSSGEELDGGQER